MTERSSSSRSYASRVTSLPALTLLLQGYLTLDWPEDYHGDPWAAVDDFAATEPHASKLVEEIRIVLTQTSSEEAVKELVAEDLGCGYVPPADGWTYTDWLAEVASPGREIRAAGPVVPDSGPRRAELPQSARSPPASFRRERTLG
jgi:hypothetical protein